MIKYYEIYFQNFMGETMSADIAIDITDVCDYMGCNIMTLNEDTIRAYIMHLFKCKRPKDTFHVVVSLDYIDSCSEPIPFYEFLDKPKAFY